MNSIPRKYWTELLPFLYISLPILLVFYLPILFFDYAYSDDYYGLWQNRIAENWTDASSNGRPIQGIIISELFSWAHNVNGLWKIRLIAIILLIINMFMLYRESLFLYRNQYKLAALFCCLPAFLPAFEIITAWSCTIPALISFTISLFAGQLLLVATKNILLKIFLFFASSILLVTALFTYQAPVVACLIPWLFRSYQNYKNGSVFKSLIPPSIAFVGSNLIYFGLIKQSIDQQGGSRLYITDSILGKIEWFYNHPFVLSGSTVSALASNHIRIATFFLTIAIIVYTFFSFYRRNSSKSSIWLIVLWILAFPISYNTGIIAAESFSSYRTQAVLSCVFVFALGLANVELIKKKNRWIGTVSIFLIFISLGAKNLYNDFVILQTKDYNNLISVIENHPGKNELHLIRTSRDIAEKNGIVSNIGMDEFGIPGSSIEWATLPMIKLILNDHFSINDSMIEIHIYNSDSTEYINENDLIELNKLYKNKGK